MEATALRSRAYKFLRPGAVAPFSGFAWPAPEDGAPGAWVDASTGNGPCRDGIHACERDQLPFWIWEELWEVDLEGEIERVGRKVRAPRGRLTRRIDTWTQATARSFAAACARRAALHAAEPLRAAGQGDAAAKFEEAVDLEAIRALTSELWDELAPEARVPMGMASDGAIRALTAQASPDPYVSAHGGAVSGYIAAMTALRVSGRDALEGERAWQADWLARELEL
jgi:hypothetical protein